MKAKPGILLAYAALLAGCAPRPAADDRFAPRPPEDLTIAITVIGPEGSSPEPARFVIEPGGLLRAAVGAGSAPEMLPPRTRRLTDAQVGQVYGMIARQGLALPTDSPGASEPRIEVTVTAGDRRSTGRHPHADADARALVDRCRRLARLEP